MKFIIPKCVGHFTSLNQRRNMYCISCHPFLNDLFITSGGDGEMKIWMNDHLLKTIKNHLQSITVIKWSYSGRYLGSAGQDSLIFIYDMKNNFSKLMLKHHLLNVLDISFSYCDQFLASTSIDRKIVIYNLRDKTTVCNIDCEYVTNGICFDPKTKYLVSINSSNTVIIYSEKNTWEEYIKIELLPRIENELLRNYISYSKNSFYISNGQNTFFRLDRKKWEISKIEVNYPIVCSQSYNVENSLLAIADNKGLLSILLNDVSILDFENIGYFITNISWSYCKSLKLFCSFINGFILIIDLEEDFLKTFNLEINQDEYENDFMNEFDQYRINELFFENVSPENGFENNDLKELQVTKVIEEMNDNLLYSFSLYNIYVSSFKLSVRNAESNETYWSLKSNYLYKKQVFAFISDEQNHYGLVVIYKEIKNKGCSYQIRDITNGKIIGKYIIENSIRYIYNINNYLLIITKINESDNILRVFSYNYPIFQSSEMITVPNLLIENIIIDVDKVGFVYCNEIYYYDSVMKYFVKKDNE